MARLVRVHPFEDPGLTRVRTGSGFRYEHLGTGEGASAREVDRIRALVIPPAWEHVWISARPDGHLQVVGTDAAGRRQYLYHATWATGRDRGRFARALALAESLPRARSRVTAALRRDGLSRERVLAAAFRLLDTAAVRAGGERSFTAHGSRGLTALQRRDVAVTGDAVAITAPGRSGRHPAVEVVDADLATVLGELSAGRPAAVLLSFERGRRRIPLAPKDVDAYVRALTGGRFTARDFRTLRGTILAADALARIGAVDTKTDLKRAESLAVKAAAQGLGTTPTVARAASIDPRVWKRYRAGLTLETATSPERALRTLLLG